MTVSFMKGFDKMSVIVLNESKNKIITVDDDIRLNRNFSGGITFYEIISKDTYKLGLYENEEIAKKNLYNLFRTICDSNCCGYDLGYEMTKDEPK